jgi:hypothetical protein
MFVYYTMKLTMKAILDECNRLAQEEESQERSRWLRSSLLLLEHEYETGMIDFETYNLRQNEILHALTGASTRLAV